MKFEISSAILLCIAIIASSMAAAQEDSMVVVTDQAAYEAMLEAATQAAYQPYGQADATGTFGTKVKAGDVDVGTPLSAFSPIPAPSAGTATPQWCVFLSYWDIGATPGLYDDNDVIYLQFGSFFSGANRIVRTNNIRMTGWESYPAGSYVKAADADIGQQLLPWNPATSFPAGISTGFGYMNLAGGAGYDLGDPIYLKAGSNTGGDTGTNDIRITPLAGFPAGSRVSLSDSDAAKPLNSFYQGGLTLLPAGPQAPATTLAPVAQLAFFNVNGNTQISWPIYDEGDVVYFDIAPLFVVSPNDVRLF
jgi:hypothetical protein